MAWGAPRRHLRLRVLFVVAGLLAAQQLVVPSAEGGNFAGGVSTGCQNGASPADPNPHTYFYSDMHQYMIDAAEWARISSLDNKSQVNTSRLSSSNSSTDLVAFDQDYTNWCGFAWDGNPGLAGLVTCSSVTTGGRCQRHEARYDISDTYGQSTTLRVALACHEQGHTLGLTHSFEGCMVDPPTNPEYHPHDINDHLNPQY